MIPKCNFPFPPFPPLSEISLNSEMSAASVSNLAVDNVIVVASFLEVTSMETYQPRTVYLALNFFTTASRHEQLVDRSSRGLSRYQCSPPPFDVAQGSRIRRRTHLPTRGLVSVVLAS